jgi:hypothetical protein
MWILIIIATYQDPSLDHIEFNRKEDCEHAQAVVTSSKAWATIHAYCVYKG